MTRSVRSLAERFLYRWVAGDNTRRGLPIDIGGVAVAGLTAADINDDGRPDLVATDTASNDVVWYENRGGKN